MWNIKLQKYILGVVCIFKGFFIQNNWGKRTSGWTLKNFFFHSSQIALINRNWHRYLRLSRTQALLLIVSITKRKDAICVCRKKKWKVWISRTLPTDTSQYKQLDRAVAIEKDQWSLGSRLGSRKKLKNRWLHICRSRIVKDYGDRSHGWGSSQDRWKSTSWSRVHLQIVEIPKRKIEDQSTIVEAHNQRFRSRKFLKTS